MDVKPPGPRGQRPSCAGTSCSDPARPAARRWSRRHPFRTESVIGMTISSPPSPVQSPPPSSRPWHVGRVIAIVATAVLLLFGTGLVLGGAALSFADSKMRDDHGYFMGTAEPWDSPGYAARSDVVVLHQSAGEADVPRWLLGTVRVTAAPATPNGVFIGIARTTEVDRYLRGVAQTTVNRSMGRRHDQMMPRSWFVDGGSPPVAPTDATFWAVSASGTGEQTIDWKPESGSWTLVVMNGEGTTPVAADVAIGADVPALDDVGTALLVAGFAVVAASAIGMVLALGRRPRMPGTFDPDHSQSPGAVSK